MRIYVDQGQLQSAIEKAEKVIRKSSIPVLESIAIKAKNNNITLTAYNLESAIIINLDGHVDIEGGILIDKSNFKLIKKLSGNLQIEDNNDVVVIKGNREVKFRQYPIEEYPEVPIEINKEIFSIIEKDFKDSLKIRLFASQDEVRPQIHTCCIKGDRIIACDGFRLAKIDLNIDNQCRNNDIMIPIESITELDKILNKKSNKVLKFECLEKTKGQNIELTRLKITGDDFTYITRLISGKYLDVDKIIPQSSKLNVTVNKNTIIKSIDFAKEIIADPIKNPLVLDITDNFTIMAFCEDKESKEVIPCNKNGIDLRIGFNYKFLLDILKTITDDEIEIKLNDSVSGMVIQGIKTNNELYFVLPIRLDVRKVG